MCEINKYKIIQVCDINIYVFLIELSSVFMVTKSNWKVVYMFFQVQVRTGFDYFSTVSGFLIIPLWSDDVQGV